MTHPIKLDADYVRQCVLTELEARLARCFPHCTVERDINYRPAILVVDRCLNRPKTETPATCEVIVGAGGTSYLVVQICAGNTDLSRHVEEYLRNDVLATPGITEEIVAEIIEEERSE